MIHSLVETVDIANEHAQLLLDATIKAVAKDIEPGIAGECNLCGEFSSRLIRLACAPCRDKYGLP